MLAGAIAGVVVCAMLAGLLGSVWLGPGAGPAPTADAGAAPAEGGMGSYEASMRTAIASNPADATALASLANLLALRGNQDEAIGLYERALAVDPGNAATRLAFARTLTDAGHSADAEVQFERVLEADPASAEALYFLGQLYERWNPPRSADAVAAYRRAAAADPDSVSAAEAANALARMGGDGSTPIP